MFQGDQISAILEALKVSPDNLPLRKYAGQLLLQSGRVDEAVEHLNVVVTNDPQDVDGITLLAQAYYQKGKFSEVVHLVESIPEQKQTGNSYLLLAKSCFALGDAVKAGEYYEKALDRDPSVEDQEFQEELYRLNIRMKSKLRVIPFHQTKQDDLFERPTVTFKDLGGLEELKEQIRMNIIYPFQNPQLFRAYGKKIGGGILLYGPPGCGKTHIARATAGECNAYFVSINIHDILDMYIGQSERNLHEIFETARAKAPAIIFIDEIDAIGGSRQMSQTATRALTNQLLSELDGIHAENHEILVIGATNTPWFVDSALRRPGRFDRVLFVAPPDLQSRIEILQIHLRDRPIEEIDFVKVAKKMEKFSGADIKGVCDLATEEAIKDAMKTGQLRKITTKDLLEAVKKVKPSTLEWFATAKNYATYSNESGIYDEILEYLNRK
jgi:SpoVK/Ycf46/Vps4 family AAA+-type ATPase